MVLLILLLAGDIEQNPGPRGKQQAYIHVGYVITQLLGTATEYVVMIAAYGIIEYALNYAQQTMNFYKNQTCNGYVVSVKASTSQLHIS